MERENCIDYYPGDSASSDHREQGKKYCETLPALSNAMIRNAQETYRSRKQILRVLIYHVTTVYILLKLKCCIE